VQLAGDLAKMNLASLLRLVRNSELTGKIALSQGVANAFIYFQTGRPLHVEAEYATGRDALMELFLWQSGAFSYIECDVSEVSCSLDTDEPLEKVLKEGIAYQEAVRYLEQLRINARTVLRSNDSVSDDPFLLIMDGKTSLAELVQVLGFSRSAYVVRLKQLVASGRAVVVEEPVSKERINLPDWVISRLKQDNADVSQAIVQMVIWADRIKCWMYQADVDLQRVITALENPTISDPGQNIEELSAEYFHPQESMLEQEIASNLNSFESSAHSAAATMPAASLSSASGGQVQGATNSSSAPNANNVEPAPRTNPTPPTYEF
jgi:hypothetical protein